MKTVSAETGLVIRPAKRNTVSYKKKIAGLRRLPYESGEASHSKNQGVVERAVSKWEESYTRHPDEVFIGYSTYRRNMRKDRR